MATLITADDAPRFGQDGFALTGLAAPSRGCATVSAWRVSAAPGATSPVHRLTSDEVFVVVAGALEANVGDRVLTARAGDALAIPPGVEFSLTNRGDEPAEAVACMAAGGQAAIGDGEPFTPPWAA
ncbi:MAG TPA: cupin domain-containing protein [Baekduia sp.]|uniref:cupin domain-containing protein n=1 Tax=Baekduia sp. TaxID=2600305 RepID=UPI002D7933F6|nr:cupin domain-containing protein [Baekduia sp.]HET6508307.1 cupin domain-containing protein [Baekduia sp.]